MSPNRMYKLLYMMNDKNSLKSILSEKYYRNNKKV